jgi:hemerythrin-like domain-containing protein
MLIQIGGKTEPAGIAGMLQECHARIRYFIGVAGNVARAEDVADSEIREAVQRVARYFSEALPLHIADEEESIEPRLSGRSPELDASLAAMRREHVQHEGQLQELLEICVTLSGSPEKHRDLRGALLGVASNLESAFSAHLDKEERIVLPAIERLLTKQEQDAIISEIRARRNSPPGPFGAL